MTKINWKEISDNFVRTVKRKSPEILTGLGIAGMLTTTVLAVKATPEALRRIESAKKRLHHKKLTVLQTAKEVWMCYIPAGITGTVSVLCLIGASTVNNRRNTALATAYGIAENTLRDYRSKVIDTIGEKKEEAILDSVDKERVDRTVTPPKEELPTTDGAIAPVLCLDTLFGRYFYSDKETLQRAANKLNWQMNNLSEPYISLNEFYMEIGLATVDVGDDLGWRSDRGLIDLHFSSQLKDGRIPILVMSHMNPPEYGFSES